MKTSDNKEYREVPWQSYKHMETQRGMYRHGRHWGTQSGKFKVPGDNQGCRDWQKRGKDTTLWHKLLCLATFILWAAILWKLLLLSPICSWFYFILKSASGSVPPYIFLCPSHPLDTLPSLQMVLHTELFDCIVFNTGLNAYWIDIRTV